MLQQMRRKITSTSPIEKYYKQTTKKKRLVTLVEHRFTFENH